MEFNEKLQELRKSRSLTQEELAKAIYVSRSAISKWESGRGYPSIDSLKELSKFFSVTIDELICADEVIAVAEDDKRAFANNYATLVCGVLDMLSAMLLFLPVFGNGADSPSAVWLIGLSGINPVVKAAFALVVGATTVSGTCGVIVAKLDKPTWNNRQLAVGMVLTTLGVAIFIVSRQPYAGMFYFALLAVKGYLIYRSKQ